MGSEDIIAGNVKQIKGRAANIAGAATGNTGQQIKGKAEKAWGNVKDAARDANRDAAKQDADAEAERERHNNEVEHSVGSHR